MKKLIIIILCLGLFGKTFSFAANIRSKALLAFAAARKFSTSNQRLLIDPFDLQRSNKEFRSSTKDFETIKLGLKLREAIASEDHNQFERLYEKLDANVYIDDNSSGFLTPLHLAARYENFYAAYKLLKNKDTDIRAKSIQSLCVWHADYTALHFASKYGHLGIVRLILSEAKKRLTNKQFQEFVTAKAKDKSTALDVAADTIDYRIDFISSNVANDIADLKELAAIREELKRAAISAEKLSPKLRLPKEKRDIIRQNMLFMSNIWSQSK